MAEDAKTTAGLKPQLSSEEAVITALKAKPVAGQHSANGHELANQSRELANERDQELATARAKLIELQKSMDTLTGEREEIASHAALLQTKVGDLTQRDARVFKKYSQMKLQMKREALVKLNRRANEMAPVAVDALMAAPMCTVAVQ